MSIERIDAWKAVCDGPCGLDLDASGFVCWTDLYGAQETVDALGWWTRGGKTYCPDCGVPDCAACGHMYSSHDYGEHHCEDCACPGYEDRRGS